MEYLPENPVLKFNPDTLEHVRMAYGLDKPGRIEEAIQILEDWIQKQNHFTQKKFDKAYLERSLIVCKGSVEKAKSKIDRMCTFRTLLPKFFTHCNVKEDMKAILDLCWVIPLPKLTKDHVRVFVVKIKATDIIAQDFLLLCRLIIIVVEYLKAHDYLKGMIIVEDFRNINFLDLLAKISVSDLREIITIVTKGTGVRISQIHIIAESKALDFVLKLAKQVLSQKIVSRVQVHSTIEAVHEYIDPNILPVEFGGTERSLDELRNEWIEVLSQEDHIEHVRNMNKARTNEESRLNETFNDVYMGMPGSFRNLVVD